MLLRKNNTRLEVVKKEIHKNNFETVLKIKGIHEKYELRDRRRTSPLMSSRRGADIKRKIVGNGLSTLSRYNTRKYSDSKVYERHAAASSKKRPSFGNYLNDLNTESHVMTEKSESELSTSNDDLASSAMRSKSMDRINPAIHSEQSILLAWWPFLVIFYERQYAKEDQRRRPSFIQAKHMINGNLAAGMSGVYDCRIFRSMPGSANNLGSKSLLLAMPSTSKWCTLPPDLVIRDTHSIKENMKKAKTGITYDENMLQHKCSCSDHVGNHPENTQRVIRVYERLREKDLLKMCQILPGRLASIKELKTVHNADHVQTYGDTAMSPLAYKQFALERLVCGGNGISKDTYFSCGLTALAARAACGSVIELVEAIANGDLKNGFAIVRPPGHHAESNGAMGYCFFNNVAVAAQCALAKPNIKRVLIVDWDIHHGNGTQEAFYDDPRVLYISLHRYDRGNYYPFTGPAEECGNARGIGTNINIPWSGSIPIGNVEYIAAFERVVMPAAHEFDPDMVIVSAGFDAAMGHTDDLGGYLVTPEGYAYMTAMLKTLADGKLAMALEGGYAIEPIARCVEACVRVLLDEPLPSLPPVIVRETCYVSKDGNTVRINEEHPERPLRGSKSRTNVELKKRHRFRMVPFEDAPIVKHAHATLDHVVNIQQEFFQMKPRTMMSLLGLKSRVSVRQIAQSPSHLASAISTSMQLFDMKICADTVYAEEMGGNVYFYYDEKSYYVRQQALSDLGYVGIDPHESDIHSSLQLSYHGGSLGKFQVPPQNNNYYMSVDLSSDSATSSQSR